VKSISPRFGSVEGGTALTLTTTNLGTSTVADVSVKIDGVTCAITSLSSTEIKCTTGSRPGLHLEDPLLEILVAGRGLVDNSGLSFRYVSLWS